MNVDVLRTEEEWAELDPLWDQLVERSASATIFLTAEWLRPWWRSFRRAGDRLHVLVAREEGAVVGLAPFYESRVTAYGLGRLRRLGFLGDGTADSEYLDFIIEPGREAETLSAFFDCLEAEGWDLAELRGVPRASPNLPLVEALAAERGYLAAAEDVPCSSVELPGDWEAYLAGLQPRFRSKVRSLLRRVPTEHGGAFEQCTLAEELPELLGSLFELHQRRWREEGRPGSFASAARRAFYAEMAEGLLRRGWLRLYSLRLAGRLVAHEFSFEHLGRVYYLQQGFDTSLGSLSVGVALKAYVIRESLARGAREYDFLGGVAAHKEKWGAQPKWCASLTLARPGLRPRWRLWLRAFAERARDRGRELTPKALLRLKRALQERLRLRRVRRWSGGRPDRNDEETA